MKDIDKAKELLIDNKTLILVKGESVIESTLDGIKPLINILNTGIDVKGYSLADKIVGKAQSVLLVKAGIKEVHAKVLSEKGKAILDNYSIPYTYDVLTKDIINRKGTDICPMEKAVKDTNDIEEAYQILKEKVLTI